MAAKGKPGRILILEDEPDVLEVLKLMLEYEGHRVVTAQTGATAIATAREKPFDVVVLDISMPDMSGIEVAQALRGDARTAGVRIAIHTALEERWVRERFPGYDLFLAKARDVELLVAGVARLLAEPAGTAPGTGAGTAAQPPPTFSVDDTAKARQSLRAALGLGADAALTAAEFIGLLGVEIDRLREAGRADAEIAEAIGKALGRAVPASLLAAHRPR
jgi:DNA-binding response OmpR family regulator